MALRRLRSDDYPRIALLASKGLRDVDIARELNVRPDTWARLLRDDAKARAALEQGKGEEHAALVGRVFAIAMSDKHPTASLNAATFLLRCRHGYRESAPVRDESRVRVEVVLPGALKPAQYKRVAARHPKTIEAQAEPEGDA
jgi:hypothetical protein